MIATQPRPRRPKPVRRFPPEARPINWPAGCRSCGRIAPDLIMWIGAGASPTAQQALALLEAV